MAAVRLLVRHNGHGWFIARDGGDPINWRQPLPYAQREQAISDALFAARMLRALGEETVVCVENSDGFRIVGEEQSMVWRTH